MPVPRRAEALLEKAAGLPCRSRYVRRLNRFRDRSLQNQQTRAGALDLVTAAIVLSSCRVVLAKLCDDARTHISCELAETPDTVLAAVRRQVSEPIGSEISDQSGPPFPSASA